MNWKIEPLNENNISQMQSVTDKPIFRQLEQEDILKYSPRYRLVSESGCDWFLHTSSMMMTKYYALFYQGELYHFHLNNGSSENGFAATPELRCTNEDAPFLLSILNEVFSLYGKYGDWELHDNDKITRNFFNEIKLDGIRLNGEPFMLPTQIQQKETTQLIEPAKVANQLIGIIKQTTKKTEKPCIRYTIDGATLYLSSLSSNNCVLSFNSAGVFLWLNSKSNNYRVDHQYINSFSSFMIEVIWKNIIQPDETLHFLKHQKKETGIRQKKILKIKELQQQEKLGLRKHIEKYLAKYPQFQAKASSPYLGNFFNGYSLLELIPIIDQIDVEKLLQKPAEVEALHHEIELLQQQIATLEVQAFCQYCLSPPTLALLQSLRDIWPQEDEAAYCAAIRSFAEQSKVELDPIA